MRDETSGPRAIDAVARAPAYALADLSLPAGAPPRLLSQNEAAAPPSPRALGAARAALDGLRLYPDPDWIDLRRAIAEAHPVAGASVLCGAGSMEIIGALAAAYLGPGRRLVAPEFTYAYAVSAARMREAPVTLVPEPDLRVDPAALADAAGDDAAIVFLANPGNPTGTLVPRAEIVALHRALRPNMLLIVDEAYGEFAPDETCLGDVAGSSNLVVLRTFSKAHALAGLRIGWAAAPPAVAAELRKVLNPNNVTGPAQAAAAASMRDRAHLGAAVAETGRLRAAFAARLADLGFGLTESHANFVLMDAGTSQAAARIEAALRTRGILVRGMGGYGLGAHLRITIGREEDMEAAAAALAALQ